MAQAVHFFLPRIDDRHCRSEKTAALPGDDSEVMAVEERANLRTSYRWRFDNPMAGREETHHLSIETMEFHKIHTKFSSVLKVQADALLPPTFVAEVAEQLGRCLAKIREIDEQTRFGPGNGRLFVTSAAQYVPELVELCRNNFLRSTIVSLQEKMANLFDSISQGTELSKVNTEMRTVTTKLVVQMKQIMPKLLLLSSKNVSTGLFSSIQQTMHIVGSELASIQMERGEGALSGVADELTVNVKEVESLVRHVGAAHSFIHLCESMQNDLRKLKSNCDTACLPLKSHEVLLVPKRPKVKIVKSVEPIRALMSQCREMQRDVFCERFQTLLKKDFQFVPPLVAIRDITKAVVGVRLPTDMKAKLFERCVTIYKTVGCAFQKYELLNTHVTASDSSLRAFQDAVRALGEEVELLAKSRKKPQGFSAEKTRALQRTYEEFFVIVKDVVKAADLCEQANSALQQRMVYADISSFKLPQVKTRYTIVSSPWDKVRRINSLSAINENSEIILQLASQGVSLLDPANSQILHPPSLKTLCQNIRYFSEQLETDLFTMSGKAYGDYSIAKPGLSILSTFAEFQQNIEEYILHLEVVPVDIMSVRVQSIVLYRQEFPITNDEFFDGIVVEMSALFDLYFILAKMHITGAISLSNICQLTYLATMCDELSNESPLFEPFRDYFRSINIFQVNSAEVTGQIAELQTVLKKCLCEWSYREIIEDFGRYNKHVSAMVAILKKGQMDAVILKLLAQLSSWLSGLQKGTLDVVAVREMQIKVRVLEKLLTSFIDENKAFRDQVPMKRLGEIINLLTALRRRFEYKRRLKQVLVFLEQVQLDANSMVASETATSIVPCGTSTVDETDIERYTDSFKSFHFSEPEAHAWEPFTANFLKLSRQTQLPLHQVDSLSPKLIYMHFRDLVTRYCQKWSFDNKFIEVVTECFGGILEEEVDMSLQSVGDFFTRHGNCFEMFCERILPHLEAHLEMVSRALANVIPTKRVSAGTNGVRISDINKGLQRIKKKLSLSDYSWYPEIVKLHHQLCPLLDDTATSSDGKHPSSLFRRLCRKSYLCFLCSRCFSVFASTSIQYAPDLASLRALIRDFLDKPSLSNDGTFLMRHQIEQILRSDVGIEPAILEASMRILRRSCSLINIKAIVEMIDGEFFAFPDFFAALPQEASCFTRMLKSRLWQGANQARTCLFKLIATDYCDGLARECIMVLHEFQSELDVGSISVDRAPVFAAMSAVRILQSLSDVADTFECVDAFLPKTDDTNLISASMILRLRILLQALQLRIEKILVCSDRFSYMYDLLGPVIIAFSSVPERFGLIDANQFSLSEFRVSWKSFCDQFRPASLNHDWKNFEEASRAVVNGLREAVAEGRIPLDDVNALEFLVNGYNVSHDPSLLFMLKLAFMYFECVAQKSAIPVLSHLPFQRAQESIKSLTLFREICLLITSLTERVNSLFKEEISIPSTFIDTACPVTKTTPDVSVTEPLTLAQQTNVAFMLRAYADSNQRELERLASLPMAKRRLDHLKPTLEKLQQENVSLTEINTVLSDRCKSLHREQKPDDLIMHAVAAEIGAAQATTFEVATNKYAKVKLRCDSLSESITQLDEINASAAVEVDNSRNVLESERLQVRLGQWVTNCRQMRLARKLGEGIDQSLDSEGAPQYPTSDSTAEATALLLAHRQQQVAKLKERLEDETVRAMEPSPAYDSQLQQAGQEVATQRESIRAILEIIDS